MKRALLASFALGMVALASAAQTPPTSPPAPASPAHFDVSADRSVLKKINGETVLELTDNVRIIHGDVTVTANRGVSFTVQRRTQLFGNVKVVQQTMTMTGDEGEYLQNEDLAILRKNVHIVDRGSPARRGSWARWPATIRPPRSTPTVSSIAVSPRKRKRSTT
jgi:lipopolysaccharide export system protein LptA